MGSEPGYPGHSAGAGLEGSTATCGVTQITRSVLDDKFEFTWRAIMVELGLVRGVGRRFPISVMEDDFEREAYVISLVSSTKEEVVNAWMEATRRYGLFDPESHVIKKPSDKPKPMKRLPRRRTQFDGYAQAHPEFWAEVHTLITSQERAELWAWAWGDVDEPSPAVKRILEAVKAKISE